MTTADRVRAQIADLLDVPPDSLAEDDDLLDHGLDSLRMMALAETWRSEGAHVPFPALLENPTLAAWTGLLDAAARE